MIKTFSFGFIAICLLSVAQTCLKVGLNHIGGFSLAEGLLGLLKLLTTGWVIAGLACYILSSIIWLEVLSKLDFSLAFPMMGSTYVFALLIGHFIFHETVGWDRLLGVGFVILGIFCLVRSGI